MCGTIDGNGNLRCIVQLCARTNVIRLLSILQKKTCFCVHLVGTEIEWFKSAIAIFRYFWEKYFEKNCKVLQKRYHLVTHYSKVEITFLLNVALFFLKYFGEKYFEKKYKVLWKSRHCVTQYSKVQMTFSQNFVLFFSKCFGGKYFYKKWRSSEERRHWVTPLFKSRDDDFSEGCAFFFKRTVTLIVPYTSTGFVMKFNRFYKKVS